MFKENALFKGGTAARFRLHPLVALVLFFVLLILSELLSLPLSRLLVHLSTDWTGLLGETASATLIHLVSPFITVIFIFFLWVKFAEKRSLSSLGFSNTNVFLIYLKGFGLGFGFMALYAVLAYSLGVFTPQNAVLNFDAPAILLSTLVVLPGWLIQGASEEIMTRGWLFQAASRKHALTGIILSSSIFALLHLGNGGMSYLSMANLILYGLFASSYALYTENLWGICAFHSAWNWAQGNVFGISVSGSSAIGGSAMITGNTQGPAYLTGGVFGAEGSVIVTVILTVATVYFFYLSYKKSKIA